MSSAENTRNFYRNQGAKDQHEKTLTAVIIRIDLFCETEHENWDESECNCGEIVQMIGAMSNA
jgi:hypothetical protein